jgi:MinD-like ATPase involved in chromosome partitioning or flagellar assembly
MGKIITFYSYKGGVGRTMCLANIGVLLAKWEYKVLVIDWDLEAPGLENFFAEFNKNGKVKKQGLIDILTEFANTSDLDSPNNLLLNNWQDFVVHLPVADAPGCLDMITAGNRDEKYYEKVRSFDVKNFYDEKKGGQIIEKLRAAWKNNYDFILVDSRTGITDIGGICTIQLPDILVLLFTATEQGFRGIGEVAEKALSSQKNLHLERLNLLLFPILTRIDGSEKTLTKKWIEKFIKGSESLPVNLNKIYKSWLPERIDRKSFIQQVLIPYVPFYSYGEGLPVEEDNYATDVQGMGYAYESIAASLATHLDYPHLLLEDRAKLLKIANKASLKALRMELQDIIGLEISSLSFTDKAREKINRISINGNSSKQSGNDEVKVVFQDILEEVTPDYNLTFSDISKIKESITSTKEEFSGWEEKDPLDQLSDHIAIKIFYRFKDLDRDLIHSLKDDLGRSIIDHVTSFVVLDTSTQTILKRLYQVEHAGKNDVNFIENNLKLIQFELSRSISDKIFYLLKDDDLLKSGKRFDEIYLERIKGKRVNDIDRRPDEFESSAQKSNLPLVKIIAAVGVILAVALFVFSYRTPKGTMAEEISRIDSLENKISTNQLKDTADELARFGDTLKAKRYYAKAVQQARAFNDTNQVISILKNQSVNLSDSSITSSDKELNRLLTRKYDKPLYKIEVFYVDSLYEKENNNGEKFQNLYSEVIADQVLRILSKQPNLVVKKRLFRPKPYDSNPYLAKQNEIRFDSDSEAGQVKEILMLVESISDINTEFVPRRIGYRSPNFISIILKNTALTPDL